MAGKGMRFIEGGYYVPKPFIDVNGKMMIEAAVSSLNIEAEYIFIIYEYDRELLEIMRNCLGSLTSLNNVIEIDYLTQGPACSALLAKHLVNDDSPLIITNCDQIMNWNSKLFLEHCEKTDADATVVTYYADTEKNSYIKLNEFGYGIQVIEKSVISNNSLNGIHFWKKGSDFVKYANKMIKNKNSTNGEFYISTIFQEMINDNKKVDNFHIENNEHNAIGTPEDLEKYLNENR